jgi:hypothetical protein
VNANLDTNHDVVEACKTMSDSQESNSLLDALYSLKELVKQHDKSWYEQKFSKVYNYKTFDYLCKDIADRYPLLVNISKEVYGWQNMTENNLGKNMTDYISMCDKLGEEA